VTVYTTNVNQTIDAPVRRDQNTITIFARYVGDPKSEVSTMYDFRKPCGQAPIVKSARQPAANSESVDEALSMRLLGNPAIADDITVEVRGAAGQNLRLSVVNSMGQAISQQTVGSAAGVERRTMRLGSEAGVYILQAATATDRQIMRIVRSN
jgi:hypothetical protein